MSVVDEAWRRIEAWLATHTPATLATLRPPAALDQVAAAEAELGLSFPADLTASLRRYDGATLDQSTAGRALSCRRSTGRCRWRSFGSAGGPGRRSPRRSRPSTVTCPGTGTGAGSRLLPPVGPTAGSSSASRPAHCLAASA